MPGVRPLQVLDGSWNTGRTRKPGEWLSSSPVLRTIVGSLNKISERNYATIRGRIMEVFVERTLSATDICDAVLVKCYQEDGYLPLYTRLIRDIQRSAADSEDGDELQRCITTFVARMVDVDVGAELGVKGDGYDEFCMAAKRKRYAIGKNRTVLSFMRGSVVVAPKSHEYFGILLSLLSKSVGGPEDHLELALDFVADYVKTFPQLGRSDLMAMRGVFDNDVSPSCSPRCRFKMMDVYDMCKSH
jgi:hypothetical protein